ncbi:MAG: hypothetical protein DHS20C15_09860 [Planctomycetota bacterium]|nr:MAG: hypothetical protein DHS20C15_09860 [Planctomycetota bacterium]
MSLLHVEGLCKRFGDRKVVDDVSFEVEAGEIVGLLGPNGAGKTTTFRMTVGMLRPDEGRVTLDGRDITDQPLYRRARLGMGYLSQEPSIFRHMTVHENLTAVLEAHGFNKRDRNTRAADLIDEFHIGHVADSKAVTLSGGERRRLELARTLALDPRLILLDEPFSGVDPIAVEDIQNLLEQLVEKDIAVLITDHAVRETLGSTDRSYILYEGAIFRHGDAASLAKDPQVRAVYLGENFLTDGEQLRARSRPSKRGTLPRDETGRFLPKDPAKSADPQDSDAPDDATAATPSNENETAGNAAPSGDKPA